MRAIAMREIFITKAISLQRNFKHEGILDTREFITTKAILLHKQFIKKGIFSTRAI